MSTATFIGEFKFADERAVKFRFTVEASDRAKAFEIVNDGMRHAIASAERFVNESEEFVIK